MHPFIQSVYNGVITPSSGAIPSKAITGTGPNSATFANQDQSQEGRLILVDISAPDFDPAPLGITLDELMYQMHAIDQAGTVYRNVEAFWAIWQAFPASTLLGLMGTVITLPVVNPAARLCYRGFARIRRYLPRRDAACRTGSCRIGRDKAG